MLIRLIVICALCLYISSCGECTRTNCEEVNRARFLLVDTTADINFINGEDSTFYDAATENFQPPTFQVVSNSREVINYWETGQGASTLVNIPLNGQLRTYILNLGNERDTIEVEYRNAQDDCCTHVALPYIITYNQDTLCVNNCDQIFQVQIDTAEVF